MATKNTGPRIEMLSMSRYNGGAAHKRQWGGSTITEFWAVLVSFDAVSKKRIETTVSDANGRPIVFAGYGPQPGNRKTHALGKVQAYLAGQVG